MISKKAKLPKKTSEDIEQERYEEEERAFYGLE